ncbi:MULTISPECIES: glycoside hydrolase family 25 protein [unclassified Streptomyces]|uniref:glycoside hydrolase family 25 protein n=1 Tax=unclassified Streptomyces TaxID=2593676 RepID=UPI00331B40E0
MGIYGQDWASYQSNEPSVAGIDFVFTKITEGLGYTSPKWVRQRDHAKRNGLVWGAYHYPHMANDPKAEADFFLSQVAWQPGDIIVLDWEGYDNANAGVSKARQFQYKEQWLRYVKAKMPGHRVGMYANADYWKNVDTTSYCGDFLWIATAGRKAGDPGIKSSWMFHQYGDNPVDKDYCPLSSREELRAWALLEEDDMPTAQEIAAAVWKYQVTNAANGRPVALEDVMAWQDKIHNTQVEILTRQNAATNAAITALATQLGQHDNVDTETLVAAVKQAIADAVIHVDVNVTGTPTPSA